MFPGLCFGKGIVENKDEEILTVTNYSYCTNRTIFILSNALAPLEGWNASKLVCFWFTITKNKKYSVVIVLEMVKISSWKTKGIFAVRVSTKKMRFMTNQNTNHDLLLSGAIKFLCSEYKYIAYSTSLSKKKSVFVCVFF